jgi:hypothetical protein
MKEDFDEYNDDELYKITNIRGAAKHIGRDVAKVRGIPLKEFGDYIKPREIVSIIKQCSVKEKDNYLMNTKILDKILQEVHNWVLGVTLSKLASKDMIDTYWDDKQNCMTFAPKGMKKNGKKDI